MLEKLKFISPIILSICLGSCSEPVENRFFNLDKINQEIIDSVGIDLFAFKQKIDTKLAEVDSLYIEENYEYVVSSSPPIYRTFGNTTIRDNGDSISIEEMDKIISQLAQALGNGIMLKDCTKADSICSEKVTLYHSLKSVIPNDYDYPFAGNGTYDYMLGLYRRKFINYEEFSYLMVLMHVAASMESIQAKWYHDLNKEERTKYHEQEK